MSKLTDKHEETQNNMGNLQKEEESLKSQLVGAQKKLEDMRKERQGYENEHKLINTKAEQLKE